MSSKTIVCAACSAAVPYGRLSCPSCGELLASVVGAARSMAGAAVAARAEPAPTAPTRAQPAPTAPELRETPSARATPDAAEHRDLAEAEAVDPDAPLADQPHWPESRPATPSAVAVASAYAADAPGAYVPPVMPATPAGPPALARSWAGHATTDGPTSSAGTSGRPPAAALIDGTRLPEFIGWLAVAGSAMAAVGFMLPWGISVIGAAGVDYFDRWGLAGPFHPLVAIALLAVLVLALVRNPIPPWVRVGLPGLGLGALLVGLIWPYLLGLPGTGPGVLVVGVGAIMLIAAGIAALAMDRHVREGPPA